jgi:hypothetical protein
VENAVTPLELHPLEIRLLQVSRQRLGACNRSTAHPEAGSSA